MSTRRGTVWHMSKVDAEQITTREAAEILGKSVRATIRLVESDALKPIRKLPGLRGAFLFDRAAVQAIADEAEREALQAEQETDIIL